MLAIPMRLPIKRMAIYGSSALLVGFVSTAALLREFAPRDSSTGVSYVQPVIRDTSTVEPRVENKPAATNQSDATTLPNQSSLVIQGGTPVSQRSVTLAPAAAAPVSSSATSTPVTAATPSQPAPAVPQPTTQPQPAITLPVETPLLGATEVTPQVDTTLIQGNH